MHEVLLVPYNGSGSFTRLYSWTLDAANGIDIDATRMDADTNDMTNNGFGLCITRDGQGSASANQPMNGYLHLNVANATLANQYSAAGQVQGYSFNYAGGTGTSDAVAASYTPSVTLADGLLLQVKTPGANATTTPTFSPNGMTATVIKKAGGAALVAGDYNSGQIIQLEYVSSGPYWELLNPNYKSTVNGVVYSGSLVSGNYPKWSGTSGTVIDSGIASAALLNFSSSLTSGNIVKNSGTAGLQIDAGIAAAAIVNFSGSLVSGNLLKNSGTAGLQVDTGIAAANIAQVGTTPGIAPQGIFFTDNGTATTVYSWGGCSVSRTGTGQYNITLGSAALVAGYYLAQAVNNASGDGLTLNCQTTSTLSASNTYSFIARFCTSKSFANANACLVQFY